METSLKAGALVVRPAVPPDDGSAAKRIIVAGAAVVAVLAGAGVTLLDYPWRMNSNRPAREAARVRPIAPIAATAKPAETAPPAPPAAAPPVAAPHPPPAAAPTPAKPEVRERPVQRQAKETSHPTRPSLHKTKRGIKRKPTIDARYFRETRTCTPGATGFLCREFVKWRLCKNRWSESPRAGEKRCYRPVKSD